MSWVWLNLPVGGLIFLAIVGIPLWMVIKRPDNRPSFDTVPAGTLGTPLPATGTMPAAGRAEAEPVPARWNRAPVRVHQVADRPLASAPRQRTARVPA